MLSFDTEPVLRGPRLTLAPLRKTDRNGLHDAASDPLIWAMHPATTRHRRDIFDPYFDFLISAGGTLAVRDGVTIIGCSRYYPVPDQPGAWGIGFTFLDRAHWGGGWNREMKSLMLSHLLTDQPHAWFHIAPGNIRSQIATTRLGAQHQYDADLALGGPPKPTRCYAMTAHDWRDATGTDLFTAGEPV